MAEPHTVLIVDDNHEVLTLITESLTLLGTCRVVTVDNGADGLARAIELRPACVVIDIRMPGLDGYQLVRALRGDPATAGLPLVILTALIQDHQRFAGLLAGADRYLTKPIKPPELVAAIEEAIRVSEREREERLRALLDLPDDPAEETP